MLATGLNPILNVSDVPVTFTWFGKLGWDRAWDWGDPPTFGAVRSGDFEIFVCQGAQGAHGTWMSIWVDDVAAVYQQCLANGLDVTRPPADEEWGVREMHVVHPDGHTFRISQQLHHGHDHGDGHEHDHEHSHGHSH